MLLTGGSIIAIAALWNLGGGKPLQRSVNWLIIGLTLILAAFLAWRREWIAAGRSITTVRPGELVKLFDNRTEVHAHTLVKPYIGKRIKITGVIDDVARAHGINSLFSFVHLKADGAYITITLPFWALTKFLPFPRGSIITVVGTIYAVYLGGIGIWNCDVVPTPSEVPPPPTPDL